MSGCDPVPNRCFICSAVTHVAGLQAVDPNEPGADPAPGRLALRRVVVGQGSGALLRRVERGDLPGQVLVPRPRRELVERHGHIPNGRATIASGHGDDAVDERGVWSGWRRGGEEGGGEEEEEEEGRTRGGERGEGRRRREGNEGRGTRGRREEERLEGASRGGGQARIDGPRTRAPPRRGARRPSRR